MSTITAILEPSPDGTLHLPIPVEWRHQAIRVKAELEPVLEKSEDDPGFVKWKGFGSLRGQFWMAPDFDEPLEDFKDYMS